MRKTGHWLVAMLCLVGVFTLSACGSDDGGGGGDSTAAGTPTAAKAAPSGGGTPFVDEETATAFKDITGAAPLDKPAEMSDLQARVAKYEQAPTALLQKDPVSKKAASGKTVALLVCGVPVCAEFNKAANEAATLLGWKTVRIDLGVSPEDFTQAYNRAIELKPDLVVGSGLPRELFDAQLTKLEKMKIPVIEWSSGIKPVDGSLYVTTDDPVYKARGLQMAEFLAADGGLKGDTAIFSVKQYSMSELFGHTIEDYLPKICSDCGVDYQLAAATDIGKLASKVTAYVQRKPDTKYIVCTFGDLCQGVGQALKAAGSDVKVVTADPGSTNYQNMANGLEYATSPLPIGQTGWQIIDLAQRIFNGDDTANTRLLPAQIVKSVPDPKSPLIGAVPDYQEQYKGLWKVG